MKQKTSTPMRSILVATMITVLLAFVLQGFASMLRATVGEVTEFIFMLSLSLLFLWLFIFDIHRRGKKALICRFTEYMECRYGGKKSDKPTS